MDEDRDRHSPLEKYDAGHRYEHAFDAGELKRLEKSAAGDSFANATDENGEETTSEDIQNQEENVSRWADKTTPRDPRPDKRGFAGTLSAHKKKAPLAAIGAILIGGALLLSLLTPGLLLIHITETLTNAFNMQETSMGRRVPKVLSRKIMSEATSGIGCQTVSTRCKFSSLNERQFNRFKESKLIKLVTDDTAPSNGRYRVSYLEYNNTRIDASNLAQKLREDVTFRNEMKRVYNSRFASVSDRVAADMFRRFGLTKRDLLSGKANDEGRLEAVQEHVNDGYRGGADGQGRYVPLDPDNPDGEWVNENDRDGTRYLRADAEELNRQGVDDFNDLSDRAKEISDNKDKSSPDILDEAERRLRAGEVDVRGGILRTVSIAGVAEDVCSIYGVTKAVSFGAKTVRAVQMMRYANLFLTTASMMKAGDADPETVAYAAGILTKTVTKEVLNAKGEPETITTKAATDSYGYRYAAFGDSGPLTPSASQFLAGGGLGGKMSGFVSNLAGYVGGEANVRKVCKTLRNPWVGGASVVVGIASMITPAGFAKNLILEGAGSIITAGMLSAAEAALPALLQDMVAGVLVDNNTFGEEAGDAIVSGTGAMMSALAGAGGNAPLKPDQAVAYMNVQQEALAQYAEEERLAHSPFDPSSPYTFMGRIVGQFVPYTSQAKSVSSITATSFAVAKRSIASIISPSAYAVENTEKTYTQCEDPEYREMDLATDPFCNPIRGIPSRYLDLDPLEIVDQLIVDGDIDEENGQPKSDEYKKFVADCITRERPLGDTGQDFDQSSGDKCFIDDKGDISADRKARWYVYHIDQRIIDGMENGYVRESGTSGEDGGGARLTEAQVLALIKEYGLPTPTSDGVNGYDALLKKLTDNPDAKWAAQAMLAGEKNFMDKGGDLKEYLNTAWLWFENGSAKWPDPYQINCNDNRPGYVSEVSFQCTVGNFQVAGYQPADRAANFVEMFNKFYSEGELNSVMESVLQNSSKAASDDWKYNSATQEKGLVSQYLRDVSGAKISDIATNRNDLLSNGKIQFMSLLLGKDPNIATALNSFAVSDGDLLNALNGSGCGYGYICELEKQLLSNMILALFKFDSMYGNARKGGVGAGSGIAAIWGGSGTPDLSYGFGAAGVADWYGYGKKHGTDGTTHTGTDIPGEAFSPIYSPVEGIVACAKNGDGTGAGPIACDGAADLSIFAKIDSNSDEIINERDGKCIPSKSQLGKGGAGSIVIKITEGGKETGDVLVLGHMAESLVTVGQTVKPNEQVGTVGCMNGWHTHVEYYIPSPGQTESGMKLVDPVTALGGTNA